MLTRTRPARAERKLMAPAPTATAATPPTPAAAATYWLAVADEGEGSAVTVPGMSAGDAGSATVERSLSPGAVLSAGLPGSGLEPTDGTLRFGTCRLGGFLGLLLLPGATMPESERFVVGRGFTVRSVVSVWVTPGLVGRPEVLGRVGTMTGPLSSSVDSVELVVAELDGSELVGSSVSVGSGVSVSIVRTGPDVVVVVVDVVVGGVVVGSSSEQWCPHEWWWQWCDTGVAATAGGAASANVGMPAWTPTANATAPRARAPRTRRPIRITASPGSVVV
ncbi:hypothetical protein JVX90_16530 [Gordonia sp. PDNC005]|uniref:hypothetical protein n=1 Tax=unclassified Gordonia (in: high G+C Gram-positive bacteria) TaxID=2657482 RepID=UPI001962CFD3|nr:hypothetical protein [Gordonia sp. PDNC005]QRY61988.1 hypothetical protein JVX90_16530 [Gordonia sp. PDNC005]